MDKDKIKDYLEMKMMEDMSFTLIFKGNNCCKHRLPEMISISFEQLIKYLDDDEGFHSNDWVYDLDGHYYNRSILGIVNDTHCVSRLAKMYGWKEKKIFEVNICVHPKFSSLEK